MFIKKLLLVSIYSNIFILNIFVRPKIKYKIIMTFFMTFFVKKAFFVVVVVVVVVVVGIDKKKIKNIFNFLQKVVDILF